MAGNTDSAKSKKIKLIFAIVALVIGGIGIAYSFNVIDLSPKPKPGAEEAGVNAPLQAPVQLTDQEKTEVEAAQAEAKEVAKSKPADGS